jgi:hypothetical protein
LKLRIVVIIAILSAHQKPNLDRYFRSAVTARFLFVIFLEIRSQRHSRKRAEVIGIQKE